MNAEVGFVWQQKNREKEAATSVRLDVADNLVSSGAQPGTRRDGNRPSTGLVLPKFQLGDEFVSSVDRSNRYPYRLFTVSSAEDEQRPEDDESVLSSETEMESIFMVTMGHWNLCPFICRHANHAPIIKEVMINFLDKNDLPKLYSLPDGSITLLKRK